jgi:hypothetical protein
MGDTNPQGLPASPIGQLLKHLGMTRDDLLRHSSQMREFLTAENSNFSRVSNENHGGKSTSRYATMHKSRSRRSSFANASNAPPLPQTPVKSEFGSSYPPHGPGSMEVVIDRKGRLNRKEKRTRKELPMPMPSSPSPSHSQASHAISRDLPESFASAQSSQQALQQVCLQPFVSGCTR